MSGLLVGGAIAIGAWAAVAKSYNIPSRGYQYLSSIYSWGRQRGIPLDVLLTWILRESSFNPREYNPEKTAMQAWACEVAGKPGVWGKNPHYMEAVQVCEFMNRGQTPDQILAAGLYGPGAGFGSYGMMQVARIVAHEVGIVKAHVDNSALFDVETNLNAGTMEIVTKKNRIYPGRAVLTDDEWSWVRAAYVGGVGILTRGPTKAREIATDFLNSLREVRTPQRVA